MQTASSSRQQTNNALTGLTFLDLLITGATQSGLSSINIDGNLVTSAMRTSLVALGYSVDVRLSDGNPNFPRCIISW